MALTFARARGGDRCDEHVLVGAAAGIEAGTIAQQRAFFAVYDPG
jgi:hypothetical protein